MKKIFAFVFCMLMALTQVNAQNIEKVQDYKDGKVAITNAVKLFSGCKMRLCQYTPTNGEGVSYGIELDLTDKVTTVGKGNLLTINFKDGSCIQLANLYDTKANVTTSERVDTYDHFRTDFVPVYSRRFNAVFAMPIQRHMTEYVPVTTSTSFADLYYMISKEDIQKVINGEVKNISIVTDSNTITKVARPFSQNMAQLYETICS